MGQTEGPLGWMVDRLIRRSVKKAFHGVYWLPPDKITRPTILVANHHGWHDGYMMYLAVTSLKLPTVLWVQELDSFPFFAKAGALPFPAMNPLRRSLTIRRTLRLMWEEQRSVLVFAEGVLHPPPALLPFGSSVEFLARKVPEAAVVPVAIRYEMSMHERANCFLMFGPPVESGPELAARTRLEVAHLMDQLATRMHVDRETFQILMKGTSDSNERWSFSRT